MPDPITQSTISDLRRLHEAATPSVWSAGRYRHGNGDPLVMSEQLELTLATCVVECDAEYIAAARNALPALLDAHEAAMGLLEELEHDLTCEYPNLCDIRGAPAFMPKCVRCQCREKITAALAAYRGE